MTIYCQHTARTSIYKALFIISAFILTSPVFSQTINAAKGIVTSEKGERLQDVNISAKNTSTNFVVNTQTDSLGQFIFRDLPAGGPYRFLFTMTGFETKELSGYTFKSNSEISLLVEMKESAKSLEQVVVTGYTSQKKKDLTGAVSILNLADAKTTPVASIDQAMQGKVAGVTLLNSGQPGGGVAVRIRGFGTINSNDPLYIIDGIPVTGALNTLNPAEIESMQILKDASSASIYGARAANGVVVITTRTGKAGRPQLLYDGYVGVQNATHLPELLNTEQYGRLWFQALKNANQTIPAGNPYGSGPDPVIPSFLDAAKTTSAGNTDWFTVIFRPALIQSHTLSFLNGTDKGSTAFNVGYLDQKGILEFTGFKRYSMRFNSDYKFFDRLRVGEFASVAYTEYHNTSENAALGTPIGSAYNVDPILPVYDINGNYAGPVPNMPVGTRNPLSALNSGRDNVDKKWRILGKAFAELKIIKGLTATTSIAVDYTNFNSRSFTPTYAEGTQVNNTSSFVSGNSNTLITTWSNTAQFNRKFGDHSLDVLAGSEFILRSGENLTASRQAIPVNFIAAQQLDAGQLNFSNSGTGFKSALFSQFGKVNYGFDDRYLASVTLRNDATSRLAHGNNTQLFPAFSVGWRLSNEKFMKKSGYFFNEIKLRYGWGQTGNQEISDYPTFSTYSLNLNTTYYDILGSNNSAQPGYSQRRVGNPSLVWETTTQSNLGLDITALNNTINLTVDVFNKKTTDLLVQPKLPSSFGSATAPFINGGSMQNKGIEIEAGYKNKGSNGFTYSVDANFAYIKNKLTGLTDELNFIASPVNNTLTRNLELQRTVIGLPIASFYGYRAIGIFQTADEVAKYAQQPGKDVGRLKFEDVNGDGTVNDNDRVFLGSPIPTITYGANIRVGYKGFDFLGFLQGVSGNKIYEFTRWYTDFFANNSNKSTRLLDAWTPQNTGSSVPMLTTSNNNNDTRPSTYFLQDGAYLRVKTLQLGYTMPAKTFHNRPGTNIRFYIQAQNLFTSTKYTGMDPEVGLQNYGSDNRNLDLGVDRGIYPVSKIITVGITAKL